MKAERAYRFKFIGILLRGEHVELFPEVPFISSDEDDVRMESVRRAILYDAQNPGKWVMDVKMQAV